MAQIFVTLPDGTTTSYELPAEEGIVSLLGRKEDCQYVINSPSVSMIHCSFAKSGSAYYMTDQNSANGILTGGNQVAQVKLEPNVPYQLGEVFLYFLDDALPGQTNPAPVQGHEAPAASVEVGPNGLPVMKARRAPGRAPGQPANSPLAGIQMQSVKSRKGMSGMQIVLVIIGLILAFYAGLSLRHYQQTGKLLPMEQLGLGPHKASKK